MPGPLAATENAAGDAIPQWPTGRPVTRHKSRLRCNVSPSASVVVILNPKHTTSLLLRLFVLWRTELSTSSSALGLSKRPYQLLRYFYEIVFSWIVCWISEPSFILHSTKDESGSYFAVTSSWCHVLPRRVCTVSGGFFINLDDLALSVIENNILTKREDMNDSRF